jgi:hypothetical protein
LYALLRFSAVLIATTDNAMMVSPSERPANCHQKYHQFVGMEWYSADPTGMLIPQKSAENSHLRHILGCLGKAFW